MGNKKQNSIGNKGQRVEQNEQLISSNAQRLNGELFRKRIGDNFVRGKVTRPFFECRGRKTFTNKTKQCGSYNLEIESKHTFNPSNISQSSFSISKHLMEFFGLKKLFLKEAFVNVVLKSIQNGGILGLSPLGWVM